MSAQRELADILERYHKYVEPLGPRAITLPAFDKPCSDFIRTHGPAIAELIEDAQYALSSLSGQDYKRLRDTLDKLTEPKT